MQWHTLSKFMKIWSISKLWELLIEIDVMKKKISWHNEKK